MRKLRRADETLRARAHRRARRRATMPAGVRTLLAYSQPFSSRPAKKPGALARQQTATSLPHDLDQPAGIRQILGVRLDKDPHVNERYDAAPDRRRASTPASCFHHSRSGLYPSRLRQAVAACASTPIDHGRSENHAAPKRTGTLPKLAWQECTLFEVRAPPIRPQGGWPSKARPQDPLGNSIFESDGTENAQIFCDRCRHKIKS